MKRVTRQIIAWYYVKFLHLRTGDEPFQINFELWSESSQPLRDLQQITFAMLNRFWSLSKKIFTSLSPILPILNGQYQAAWNANHKFWEGTFVKIYKIQLQVILFALLHQFWYQQISFLQLSRISFSIIWKQCSSQMLFFNEFIPFPKPTPLNSRNLLNMIKVYHRFSLKCLLKYFFQKSIDKFLQNIF